MRTTNPALSAQTFLNAKAGSGQMTIQGAVNKSFILIAIVIVCAYFSWQSAFPEGWSSGSEPTIPVWYYPVIIAAFIVGLVLIRKRTWAPYLTPVYAILEGFTLGAISALFEFRYPGIVIQAVLCTLGTFLALLMVYRSGWIKVTENLRLGIAAATGGIALVYLIDLGLRFFGHSVPFIHENGPVGIIVSLLITAVAALNLVLDFDFIEYGAKHGAPQYMEWYSAFGLLVTLVWLYIEFLRLLGKGRK